MYNQQAALYFKQILESEYDSLTPLINQTAVCCAGIEKLLGNVDSAICQRIKLMSASFSNVEQGIHKFKDSILQITLSTIQSYQNYRNTDQQKIDKLEYQLTRQINTNKMMKMEVLELNELIGEHLQINKKKLQEKDEIIKNLKQNIQTLKLFHNNQNLCEQGEMEKFMNSIGSIKIIDDYQSSSPQAKRSLEVIREEQELISNLNPTSRDEMMPGQKSIKNSKEDSNQSFYQKLKESNTTLIREQSLRRSDSKQKTRNFIEDFRKNIQEVEQCKAQQTFNKSKDHSEFVSRSSSQSYLSIGRSDTCDISIPYKNVSPKKMQFVKNRNKQVAKDQRKIIKQQSAKSKIIEIKNIFKERSISRDKLGSKQKIHLTQKQNINKQNRGNSRERLVDKDLNIVSLTRPSSKQKISLTTKPTIIQRELCSHKIKMIPIKSITNRRNLSQGIQKNIREHLQCIEVNIGDRKSELKYQGVRLNGMKSGKGRLQYSNGMIYEGQFKQNARHGYGALSLNKKIIYEGQWQRDKICGQGILRNIHLINKKKISENVDIKNLYYTGEFQQNKFHGSGTLFLSSNQKFVSRFNDGLPQGEYAFYNKFGDIQMNVWDQYSE